MWRHCKLLFVIHSHLHMPQIRRTGPALQRPKTTLTTGTTTSGAVRSHKGTEDKAPGGRRMPHPVDNPRRCLQEDRQRRARWATHNRQAPALVRRRRRTKAGKLFYYFRIIKNNLQSLPVANLSAENSPTILQYNSSWMASSATPSPSLITDPHRGPPTRHLLPRR